MDTALQWIRDEAGTCTILHCPFVIVVGGQTRKLGDVEPEPGMRMKLSRKLSKGKRRSVGPIVSGKVQPDDLSRSIWDIQRRCFPDAARND
jgi:hypothetical protein